MVVSSAFCPDLGGVSAKNTDKHEFFRVCVGVVEGVVSTIFFSERCVWCLPGWWWWWGGVWENHHNTTHTPHTIDLSGGKISHCGGVCTWCKLTRLAILSNDNQTCGTPGQ